MGAKVAERWSLASLREYRLTALAELNTEIARLPEAINGRSFQKRDGTRRSLFTTLEALVPGSSQQWLRYSEQVR